MRSRTARSLFSASLRASAILLLACACVGTRPESPVLLTTEPPGVIVRVNGETSGFVTPCMLGLSLERPHRIDLELDGYRTETRMVVPGGYEQAVLWHEMNTGHRNWRWPLWLNIDDFFFPVRTKAPLQPGRIYVRMRRTVDG